MEKRGLLRFAGYAIGSALGVTLILNVRSQWFSWWVFTGLAAAGFALDAWCDWTVVRLSATPRHAG